MINSPRGYYPSIGSNSISNQVENIAKSLLKLGYKIDIFLSDGKSDNKNLNLIKYQKIDWRNKRIRNDSQEFYTNLRKDFYENHVLKNLNDNYDIIHTHNLEIYKLLKDNKEINIPIILTLHCNDRFFNQTLKYNKEKYLKNIVFISEWQRDKIGKTNNLELNNKVIRNKVKEKLFDYCDEKEDYYIYSGRLCKIKGFNNLINLFSHTSKKIKIAGRLIENDPVFKEYPIEWFFSKSNVEYLGELPQKKLSSYISKAKGTVHLHNWEEPFGLSIAESLLSGTPVLTSDGGEPKNFLNQKNSIIIKRKNLTNIKLLSQKLKELERLKPKDCLEGYKKEFNHNFGEEYAKVYKEVVN